MSNWKPSASSAATGIEGYVRNPFFPVNTLQMMRGAAAAEINGGLEQYVEAMFHHMWEAPKKMDDPEVFRDALTTSGLDADTVLAQIQDPGGQGKANREHRDVGRARCVRIANVLRR